MDNYTHLTKNFVILPLKIFKQEFLYLYNDASRKGISNYLLDKTSLNGRSMLDKYFIICIKAHAANPPPPPPPIPMLGK